MEWEELPVEQKIYEIIETLFCCCYITSKVVSIVEGKLRHSPWVVSCWRSHGGSIPVTSNSTTSSPGRSLSKHGTRLHQALLLCIPWTDACPSCSFPGCISGSSLLFLPWTDACPSCSFPGCSSGSSLLFRLVLFCWSLFLLLSSLD